MEIIRILSEGLDAGQIKIDESMSKHTTFKIGGGADVFVMPRNAEQLNYIVKACRDTGLPYFLLGNGSNLLVSDKGIRGVVISFCDMNNIELLEDNRIYAGSGALLPQVSKFAAKHSLRGLEFAEGIPGSVGGGVIMNAGAYEGEIAQVFETAQIIDKECQLRSVDNAGMNFSYRKSAAQTESHIITSVIFKLNFGDSGAIAEKMSRLRRQRTDKQPLNMPSAGSAFKRPPGRFAGKLIMDAGLRGFSIGAAQVSEKHCGFIVNTGGATCADVIALIEHVRNVVNDKFGIMLEPEVKTVGEL